MAAAQLQWGPSHFQAKHGPVAPRRNKEDPVVMDSWCLKQGERLTTSVTRKHTQIISNSTPEVIAHMKYRTTYTADCAQLPMSWRFLKSLSCGFFGFANAMPTLFCFACGCVMASSLDLDTTCVGQTLMRLNPATNSWPAGLHISYLDSPAPCKSSAHAPPDPKTQPASKEEVPHWKHPFRVFWRYIVTRFFW